MSSKRTPMLCHFKEEDMEKTKRINGLHLNHLAPLKKWRVLDLKIVYEDANYGGSISSFRKLIINLEKNNIIKSFIDPQTSKKYLHLTEDGEAYLGVKEGAPAICKETFFHDSRVTEVCKLLLEFNTIKEIQLEHEFIDRSNFTTHYKICPDALIFGERKGVKFRMAFELELTRKTMPKYLAKAQQYLDSSAYDYAFYLFGVQGVFESYRQQFLESFGEKAFSKIILGINKTLYLKAFDINETKIFFQNKEVSIDTIFKN